MVFHGKWYDEVNVGESFGTSVTVTETHLVLGSGMFGDFNPLHVDEEFSKTSMFGGRILHGPFTSALVASPIGIYFAGTTIAYLEPTEEEFRDFYRGQIATFKIPRFIRFTSEFPMTVTGKCRSSGCGRLPWRS